MLQLRVCPFFLGTRRAQHLCPDGRSIPLNPEWIENEAGERVESTPHAMEKYTIPTPELPPMSLLRRKTV